MQSGLSEPGYRGAFGLFHSVLFASLLFVPVLGMAATPPAEPSDTLQWTKLAPLPDREGFAYPYAGISNGALLVAGGANFPDKKPWEGGAKIWYDSVFVLAKPAGAWKSAGRLPRPLGYGVSLTTKDGVVCLGGSDAQKHYAEVFIMRWVAGRLAFSSLPPLPKPCANFCGAILDNTIYVAGGLEKPDATSALQTFWALDLAQPAPQWRELPPWPGPGRMLATAAEQDKSFFLIGGSALAPDAQGKPARTYLRDAYRYQPDRGWQRMPDLPHPVAAAPTPAPALGPSSLLILGGDDGSLVNFTPLDRHPGFPGAVLIYDSITNTWRASGKMPVAHVTTPLVRWGDSFIMPSGEVRPGVRSPAVWSLRAAPRKRTSGG